jgi:hypothetical protein
MLMRRCVDSSFKRTLIWELIVCVVSRRLGACGRHVETEGIISSGIALRDTMHKKTNTNHTRISTQHKHRQPGEGDASDRKGVKSTNLRITEGEHKDAREKDSSHTRKMSKAVVRA